MGLADVAFSMYRNGFTAYLGGNPLSLGFLTDRGVAATMTVCQQQTRHEPGICSQAEWGRG
jgi:hypothetical protein